MEGYVATKLDDFDRGRISRRRLIEALTFAATSVAATGSAKAQTATPSLKVALVNHISYSCPNFKQAADWYSKVFNLDQVGPTNRDVALPFGKKDDQPYGAPATDVPLSYLIIRTPNANAPPPPGAPRPRPKAQATI